MTEVATCHLIIVAMSKLLSISALEEQWDVLERLHSDFVRFWAAQPEVNERVWILGSKCPEIGCLILISTVKVLFTLPHPEIQPCI